MPELPILWRTKLRSTRPDPPVVHSEQVAHCVRSGLIGIGWGLQELPDGAPLEDVLDAIRNRDEEGWRNRSALTVRRFAVEAKIGDFVWTRDTSGRYLLCKITGPYRYDYSTDAIRVDVHQVRNAAWAPDSLNDLDVPGAVIRAFVGTADSFSRIHDHGARAYTGYLWEKVHDRPLPRLDVSRREILTQFLDPYDVEDLVYVWLQVAHGCIALPRARKRDTPAYEYTMIHRETGRRAIAQIKTGAEPVDLPALVEAADSETDTFAYATSGNYIGSPNLGPRIIRDEELLSFAAREEALLPPRVRNWFELAND